jgi:hypothetical protein
MGKILVEINQRKNHFAYQGVDVRIALKLILED